MSFSSLSELINELQMSMTVATREYNTKQPINDVIKQLKDVEYKTANVRRDARELSKWLLLIMVIEGI